MERSNFSTKYKEVISKSLLIQQGFPAIYQLKLKKEEIGPVTKVTLGKKNISKINKTILLVGESGAGKSTLINTMVNYTMGVKWEDKIWFQIVEEDGRNQSDSQTSDVIMYEIFGFEGKTMPFSLTIIDTPGFGDTRGIDYDTIVSHRLFDLFRSEDGVHEIHAVGLVMKATDNRVNDRLSYVLNSVMSLFGRNLENNIVALLTHSDGQRPRNVIEALEKTKIKCAKNEKNQPVYFLFDNCQNEDRTEEEDTEFLQIAEKISDKGMRALTEFLEKTAPTRVMTTAQVLNERISLMASIQNLQARIQLTEQKEMEINKIQEALKKHSEEMSRNENFTVEITEVYKAKEPTKGKKLMRLSFFEKAMCCTVCEENCHYPGCTLVPSPQHCEVMKKGRCTVCTGKCPASAHVREAWRYVNKTRRVQWTLKAMEEKYMKNKADCEKKLSLLKHMEKDMKELSTEKSQLVDEAFRHVVQLEQIALKVDSVSTFLYLDFLIEKLKEKGDGAKVQKLEEMKSRQDEGTKLALQYVWGKITDTMQ
ncbi:septin-2-like [Xiphophorus couchianus]|uniref:septin-2-like n=1 Tax=Xiphophorus couchianus TaxID=32473 RepID=UPI001016E73B|nr:septin-2-like [Xiphophorus couchianus]XP_027881366.1 septin-2-like [Xiphophorus couchianus]